MTQALGGNDFSRLAAQTRERLDVARQLKEQLAELVGRAESVDGAVRAEFTDADGLSALVVNPRAMRFGSEELSESILRVVREAKADLEARKRAAMRETGFDPDSIVDADAVRERLNEATDAFRRTAGDSSAVLDLIRRTTGG
ncbi:MAG: hypothetical protein AUG44_23585 [Actinobacteria bacterium 13_1_20CM_3_71_11]|nr:MAG: hypothetical protein AUG44_23585 [Actinobacteria bacterium 13_1_20CM_3_71_11]